jgi:hypothetical protein
VNGVTLLMLALWALGIGGVVRDWRSGPADRAYRLRASAPLDGSAWFAFRRSTLVQQVAFSGLVVCLVFPGQVLVGLAVVAGSIVVCLTIALFNRPRFLVPPKLRYQPGLVAEARAEA